MIKLLLTLKECNALVLFSLGILLLPVQTKANECLQNLPTGAIADGQPRLCQSDVSGTHQDYACQDYMANGQRFRVLYQGGLTPTSILQLSSDNRFLPLAPVTHNHKVTCPLPIPASIPSQARHLGTGVCRDEYNNAVPCSLYQYTAARQVNRYRYIVFHKTDHRGQPQAYIDARFTEDNRDAMAAELAYQIGMSLKRTECCVDQAAAYLAYAHRLYPNARIYREAYQLSMASTENANNTVRP